VDVLFGCCVSSNLYALNTQLPIVYFSDATSFIIRDTYPALNTRGPAHIQTLHDIERTSVDRTHAAIFASPVVRESAVNDLRIPRDRTHVVPMGANVTPAQPDQIHAPAPPPTRDNCQLLIIAADPIRKRVDLALDATETLRARGINATLHIVGPGTERSNASPAAKPAGRLKLSDPTDRQTHQQLLRESHIQLLPSLGEAFGIAPIESAHFARPSIVAGAGGLTFVVQHNQTGLVIDPELGPDAWADAIESLIDNPDRYQSMSTAALTRTRAELNWTAWGASVAQIIRDTLANRA
jgi:glycosyltransferase involved in cell wall biosynthesis